MQLFETIILPIWEIKNEILASTLGSFLVQQPYATLNTGPIQTGISYVILYPANSRGKRSKTTLEPRRKTPL